MGFPGRAGVGPHVINQLALDVDRELLALLDQVDELLVGGVPSRQEVPADEDLVAGAQLLDDLVGNRRLDSVFCHCPPPLRCDGAVPSGRPASVFY